MIKSDGIRGDFTRAFFSFTDRLNLFKNTIAPAILQSVMQDRWLSVNEIAAYLGIKRATVYKWIPEKLMPARTEWVAFGSSARKKLTNRLRLGVQGAEKTR